MAKSHQSKSSDKSPDQRFQALRARITDADLFRIRRMEDEDQRRMAKCTLYWTGVDQCLENSGCGIRLSDIRCGYVCWIKYSTNMLELWVGTGKFDPYIPKSKRLCINMWVRGRHIPQLYDSIWYPHRNEIEDMLGQPIEWMTDYSGSFLHIYDEGQLFDDPKDWPEQFAWFSNTLSSLRQALFGGVPFDRFIWNQFTDEEKVQNSQFFDFT